MHGLNGAASRPAGDVIDPGSSGRLSGRRVQHQRQRENDKPDQAQPCQQAQERTGRVPGLKNPIELRADRNDQRQQHLQDAVRVGQIDGEDVDADKQDSGGDPADDRRDDKAAGPAMRRLPSWRRSAHDCLTRFRSP
jgi:hypothetical protein